jgi:putative DNA primase/helicase
MSKPDTIDRRTVARVPASGRRKAAAADPFDTSAIARPLSEKSLVANLVPAFRAGAEADEVKDARRIIGIVQPEMLVDPIAADAVAAFAEAINAEPPTIADVSKAAQRRAKATGGSARDIMQFVGDVAVEATSWRAASRLAEEAAHEIAEAHAKRLAVLACADAVHALKLDNTGTAALIEIRDRLGRITDAIEQRAPDRGRLVMVRASEIECTAINWLWPQRIVGDGLTIITGPVGISKSLISVDTAARVTTNGKWPDGTGHAPLGSVLLFGAEDDPGKVVVPRLAAAGADLSRVHVCQGATTGRDDDEPAAVTLERHIGQLRDTLDTIDDCRLIVFDPLPDYIAADENSSAEVRAALVPLARLAQERNVAVVAVLHQNKKNDLTTVQRIAGSGAFAQIARVVLSIGTHPEDVSKAEGKRRVMLVSKNNYGERDVGQAYEIQTRGNGQPGLCWLPGIVSMDADELTRRPTGGHEHEDRRGAAVDALREMLAVGEKSASAATEELQDRGFGRRQIDHAVGSLNVIKRKARDGWYWRLPAILPGDPAKVQPDPAFAAWAPDEIEQFNST